jgi:hypothetical protein
MPKRCAEKRKKWLQFADLVLDISAMGKNIRTMTKRHRNRSWWVLVHASVIVKEKGWQSRDKDASRMILACVEDDQHANFHIFGGKT